MRQQCGWLLLETLLATVIGFFVLTAATQFFFASTRTLTQLMQQWHRLNQYEKWRLWLHDVLDSQQALVHCGAEDKIRVEKIEKNTFSIHTCRRIHQQWHWVSTRYYLRKKKSESYLYEKTAAEPGVAWIPGVIRLQAKRMLQVKPGCAGLIVDWQSDSAHRSDLIAHFTLGWCDEKPTRSR